MNRRPETQQADADHPARPRLLFICHGNTCRSVMAEQIARAQAAAAGVEVDVDSAGVSSGEAGNPIDPRAARVLRAHGYPVGEHIARRVTAADLDQADLVIAAEQQHLNTLRKVAGHPEVASKLALVSDFIPGARAGSPLPDPWYADQQEYQNTLDALEAAMPQILSRLGELAD